EDGIRDDLVTGVQTCALPISKCRHCLRGQAAWRERSLDPRRRLAEELYSANRAANPRSAGLEGKRPRLLPANHRRPARHGWAERSEERRVGKGVRVKRVQGDG